MTQRKHNGLWCLRSKLSLGERSLLPIPIKRKVVIPERLHGCSWISRIERLIATGVLFSATNHTSESKATGCGLNILFTINSWSCYSSVNKALNSGLLGDKTSPGSGWKLSLCGNYTFPSKESVFKFLSLSNQVCHIKMTFRVPTSYCFQKGKLRRQKWRMNKVFKTQLPLERKS